MIEVSIIFGHNIKSMNLDDKIQPSPFFGDQQSLHHSCYNRRGNNHKETHALALNENQSRQIDQFIQSPSFRPSSFFFTPTSPKYIQFDIANQSTAKSDYNYGSLATSICQKLKFSEMEQNQELVEEVSIVEQKVIQVKITACEKIIKRTKGLRNLTESIYLIVYGLGKTTYKLVAERLISDIIKNGVQFNKIKDEQNVKRRVYDALNVLVAVGMFQKNGNQVNYKHKLPKKLNNRNKFRNQRQIVEKKRVELALKNKQELINQKRKILQKLKEKKQYISRIIKRNQLSLQKEVFNFPLISILIQNQKIRVLKNSEGQVIFRFSCTPSIYGDVDLMSRITDHPNAKKQIKAENIYNVIGIGQNVQSEMKKVRKTNSIVSMGQCAKFQSMLQQ